MLCGERLLVVSLVVESLIVLARLRALRVIGPVLDSGLDSLGVLGVVGAEVGGFSLLELSRTTC